MPFGISAYNHYYVNYDIRCPTITMTDLPNFFTLFAKVGNSLPIDELYNVFLVAIGLLAVHALLIL